MNRFVLSLLIVAGLASTAAAHGGVAFRATPFRPFRGPQPVHHHNVGFRANFSAPFYYGGSQDFRFYNDSFAFRGGYSQPFYYNPQPIYIPTPQPIVIQQPQPVVYSSQSYSYGNYTQPIQTYAGPQVQTYTAPQAVYILPDGRTVLPDGQVLPAQ